MSKLARHLTRRIAAFGPISVADYMADCLLHPTLGYYATRDPLGAAGDFTTAPEISQMFGELIGLALAQTWMDLGSPASFTLAELGPGRGTLMADLLRATRGVPGFHDAAELILVEASPVLRARQEQVLEGYAPLWVDNVEALPNAPLFLIANEFFDALAIRQFQRDTDGWRERQVGLQDDTLCFGLSAATLRPELADRLEDTKPGDLVETCAPASATMTTISDRIARNGGAALIVDYGDWRSLGDTFQAVRQHQPEHPLAHPGEADLTAHVDFEALASAAQGVAHTRLTEQGLFLERLGIAARAEVLAKGLSGPALETHLAAFRRLTLRQEMGSLFKVMGLHPRGTPPPPGLEA